MSIQNEFTSTQAAEILQINQNTFSAWMNSGWIKPSVQKSASRRGVRNIFNQFDLCRIQLFRYNLAKGFDKMDAAAQSQVSFENVGPEAEKYKYIIVKEEFSNLGVGFFNRSSSLCKNLDLGLEKVRENINKNDSVAIINLLNIKNQVDNLIEKAVQS